MLNWRPRASIIVVVVVVVMVWMNLSEWKRSGGDGDDDHVTAGGRDLVVSKQNNRKIKNTGHFPGHVSQRRAEKFSS